MATNDNYGLFWDSDGGDRVYNAASFETWLKHFFRTGVFANEMAVTASSGMTLAVSSGYCNLEGKVKFFEASTVTLSAANSTYPRIDTIVIERNDTDRNITLKAVTGAYAGDSPVATAPVRADGVYQIVLANVRVNAGVTEITQANITDKRSDNTVCGIVAGTVTQMDFNQFTTQFNTYFAEFKRESESDYDDWIETAQASFLAWYEAMEGQLSEDAAGNLQEQINAITYYYVQDNVLYLPNTAASVANGVLTVGTTEGE